MTYVGAPPRDPDAVQGRGGSGCATAIKILVVLFALFVLSVGALLFWGFTVFEGQVLGALQADPVVREHLGRLRDVDFDFEGSGAAEGTDVFAFDVSGDRGRGHVVAHFVTVDQSREEVESGTLTLADGREFAIGTGAATPDPALEPASDPNAKDEPRSKVVERPAPVEVEVEPEPEPQPER